MDGASGMCREDSVKLWVLGEGAPRGFASLLAWLCPAVLGGLPTRLVAAEQVRVCGDGPGALSLVSPSLTVL